LDQKLILTSYLFKGEITRKYLLVKELYLEEGLVLPTYLAEMRLFFEFQDQWSPDGSIDSLGGKQSLRGYRANRFLARSLAFANFELRVRLAEARLGKQRFGFGVAPFFEAGSVRDKWQDLNFKNIKTSYGSGTRIAWSQSTIISFDYGV
jgi:hemolysin activation/secretion protein